VIGKYLLPAIGPKRLVALTVADDEALLRSMAARGLARNSPIRARAVLVLALTRAERRDLVVLTSPPWRRCRWLRRGEVLGLRWEDVDPGKARVSVRQSLVVSKGVVMLSEPETAAARRSVVLYSQTVEALRRQRRTQAAERLLVGPASAASSLVFATTIGTVIHPPNLARDSASRALVRGCRGCGCTISVTLRPPWR
jgi:integrase